MKRQTAFFTLLALLIIFPGCQKNYLLESETSHPIEKSVSPQLSVNQIFSAPEIGQHGILKHKVNVRNDMSFKSQVITEGSKEEKVKVLGVYEVYEVKSISGKSISGSSRWFRISLSENRSTPRYGYIHESWITIEVLNKYKTGDVVYITIDKAKIHEEHTLTGNIVDKVKLGDKLSIINHESISSSTRDYLWYKVRTSTETIGWVLEDWVGDKDKVQNIIDDKRIVAEKIAQDEANKIQKEKIAKETEEAREAHEAYERGDYSTAFNLFLSQAKSGNSVAQVMLALMYIKGKGVSENYSEAKKWLVYAAEQNFSWAYYLLGGIYYSGYGEEIDYQEATKWYMRAAEQYFAEAQYELGNFYYYGIGVSRDYLEAQKWYKLAAEQGIDNAQYNLGNIYYYGYGVKKDYKEAFKWFRLAAEQNHIDAQYNLGVIYKFGQGVSKNYREAIKWWRLAAEQNHIDAQNNLGYMYDNGIGLPKNFILAYKWFSLSASQGDDEAKKNLSIVEQKMTQAQIAEAQHLAFTFLQDHELKDKKTRPDYLLAEPKLASSGSGFFVNKKGHLVTNHHVINGCRILRVAVPSGTKKATIIAVSEDNDLAVLSVKNAEVTEFATFRTHEREKLGEDVMVAGYPLRGLLADDLNITTGSVSALAGISNDRRMLQITAPVQQGNSGGPLLDETGQVIGVVVGKLHAISAAKVLGEIPQNVNFAIKGTVVRSFLDIYGVDYQPGATNARPIGRSKLASQAKSYTFPVECLK